MSRDLVTGAWFRCLVGLAYVSASVAPEIVIVSRFCSVVVAELRSRGTTPIPCGRATNLDLALRDADAVINCVGPFAATAAPTIESAIRAGIPYLDVTAEIEVVMDTFARYASTSIPIVPAVAFYGGLGDLLAHRRDRQLAGRRPSDHRVRAEQLAPHPRHPGHGSCRSASPRRPHCVC